MSKSLRGRGRGTAPARGRRASKVLAEIPDEDKKKPIPLELKYTPKKKLKRVKQLSVSESESDSDTGNKNTSSDSNGNSTDTEQIFKTDIPEETTCNKCSSHMKAISVLKAQLEEYKTALSIGDNRRIETIQFDFVIIGNNNKFRMKKHKDKHCFYDSYPLDDYAFPLVDVIIGETVYVLPYFFSSFGAALAHNLYFINDSRVQERRANTHTIARKMYGIDPSEDFDIPLSPPKSELIIYNGKKDIDDFRNETRQFHKRRIVYVYPIKSPVITIEEQNTQDLNITDGEKYRRKRSKPKKSSASIFASTK
jgi:hypothetical protein